MSAPILPPPRSNSHLASPPSRPVSQEHASNSWPSAGKIKNNPIGGHYAGHYGLGTHLTAHQAADDNDSFWPDTGIEKMVDQEIEGFVPKAVVEKKSDHKQTYALNDEVAEEGQDLEKEMTSHHHPNDVSKHFAVQSARIGNQFEPHHFSMS